MRKLKRRPNRERFTCSELEIDVSQAQSQTQGIDGYIIVLQRNARFERSIGEGRVCSP